MSATSSSSRADPAMEHATRLRGDVIAGATLAALGVYILATASEWTFLANDGPGPGFFPICYGVLLVIGSLALVATSLRRGEAAPGEPVDWPGVGRAIGMWAVFVLTIPVMTYFGFAAAVAILVVFSTRVVFPASWTFTLLGAVLTPIAFFLVFPLMLQVALPVGRWTGF
jgi:putative tricarboxylic transport membrane protein